MITYVYDGARLLDCPKCGQAVRVDRHGNLAKLQCYGGCDEPDVIAGIDMEALLRELDELHANGRGPAAGARRLVATAAAYIPPERTRWAWAGRVPLGAVTLLAGRQGLGKSTLLAGLAAELSRGALAGDLADAPADSLLLGYEDHPASTTVPRLMAGAADLDRVHILSVIEDGRPDLISVPEDVDRIAALAAERGARLLVIDPLVASLPGRVDAHRDQDVRRALAQLAQLAEASDLAVLCAIHLRKGSSSEALDRVSGSIAFTAAARSVLAFGRTAEEDDGVGRVLAHAKSNVGPLAPSLAYKIESTTVRRDDGAAIPTSRLVNEGECDTTAGELLSPQAPEAASEVEAAVEWLADELADGEWRPTAELREAARKADIAWRTVGRARERLGVETDRHAIGASHRAVGHWRIPVVPRGLARQGLARQETAENPRNQADSEVEADLPCQDSVLGTTAPDEVVWDYREDDLDA
jgi:AAA domain